MKQQGKGCGRRVLLYCCKTWELPVLDEARLRGGGTLHDRMMCRVRLIDRASTEVLHDRVGLALKIGDRIIQSCLR